MSPDIIQFLAVIMSLVIFAGAMYALVIFPKGAGQIGTASSRERHDTPAGSV